MVLLHMSCPWQKRPGSPFFLRKRVPTKYLVVAGVPSGIVSIPLNTKDEAEAKSRCPEAWKQWETMLAEWERQLNAVVITPEKALEIVALWLAWITAGAELHTDGLDSEAFSALLGYPVAADKRDDAKAMERIRFHSAEALRLAKLDATPDSLPILHKAMRKVVASAYLDHETGPSESFRATDELWRKLPKVTAPTVEATQARTAVSLKGLAEAWARVVSGGVVKPSGISETLGTIRRFSEFLGHDDAALITENDVLRWREKLKADGISNNRWNPLHSMSRQVFEQAVRDGKLKGNPFALSLRLRKAPGKEILPFTDEEAKAILLAAREAERPSVRWSHWIMAFSGMRVSEALQLTGDDIRQEDGYWYVFVNDGDPEKKVKGRRGDKDANRRVPIHSALIAEGFLAYAQQFGDGEPLFPDKKLDKYGKRGGDAWKITGRWVHKVLPDLGDDKSPDHSWRHRVKGQMVRAGVDVGVFEEVCGWEEGRTSKGYGGQLDKPPMWKLVGAVETIKSPLDE